MSVTGVAAVDVSANGYLSASNLNAASQQVQDAVRVSSEFVSRAVYTTCYCAAYGATFPVVFLAHLIPGGLPLTAGIADGARAAHVYVRGIQLATKRQRRHQSSSHHE